MKKNKLNKTMMSGMILLLSVGLVYFGVLGMVFAPEENSDDYTISNINTEGFVVAARSLTKGTITKTVGSKAEKYVALSTPTMIGTSYSGRAGEDRSNKWGDEYCAFQGTEAIVRVDIEGPKRLTLQIPFIRDCGRVGCKSSRSEVNLRGDILFIKDAIGDDIDLKYVRIGTGADQFKCGVYIQSGDYKYYYMPAWGRDGVENTCFCCNPCSIDLCTLNTTLHLSYDVSVPGFKSVMTEKEIYTANGIYPDYKCGEGVYFDVDNVDVGDSWFRDNYYRDSCMNFVGYHDSEAVLALRICPSGEDKVSFGIRFSEKFATTPYCGNGICDAGETFSTCIIDCGAEYRMKLQPNELLAMETFAGGATISKTSTRYPVVVFSHITPAIIMDAMDNAIIVDKDNDIYQRLDSGETIRVPEHQTYSLFYIIENNYQLPAVCDVVDVDTGQCAQISPGVVTVCTEGQFDPKLGLCVTQPTSKIICTVGRYDTAQAVCIWNPPLQAVCGAGSTYDPDTQKCYYYPEKQAICAAGYDYDSKSGKCLRYPEKQINCPAGYAYDMTTDKCIKYPLSQIICTAGTTFNPQTQKCEYTPPSAYTCIIGFSYNSDTKRCEKFINDTNVICGEKEAVYDPKKGTCIRTLAADVICDMGILLPDKSACIYTPDTKVICTKGIYAEDIDKCIYRPSETLIECISPFTYNEQTKYCEYTPTPTCVQGTYDKEKDGCVYKPDLQYLCIDGVLETVDGEQQCTIRPDVTFICKEGTTFDRDMGKCIKKPDVFQEEVNKFLYGVIIILVVALLALIAKFKRRI